MARVLQLTWQLAINKTCFFGHPYGGAFLHIEEGYMMLEIKEVISDDAYDFFCLQDNIRD